MPRKQSSVPVYCLHRHSGKSMIALPAAIITWDRMDLFELD